MKKRICLSIIIIFAGLLSYYYFGVLNKVHEGQATIIKRDTFEIMISEVNNKEMKIHSNVFNVGDKVNVKYLNNKITKLEAIIESPEDKARLVSNITSDTKMSRYRKIITGSFEINDMLTEISHYYALPVKISNQTYKTISPADFFEIKYNQTDTAFVRAPKGTLIKLISTEYINILNFINEHSNETRDINYNLKNKEITFESTGVGIYVVTIELENKDIFDYIFI